MKTSSLIFLVSAFGILIYHSFVFSQPEFIQHEVTNTFTKGADVIATDLNQDGYMDIIGVNTFTNGEISWWKNDGYNEFTKIIIRDNLNSVRSVRAMDMNNDQQIDIVAAIYGANEILYLENIGDEVFEEFIVDANFVGAHTVDIKDVNDDGHLDILCSGFDFYFHNGEIAWWQNNGLSPIEWTKNLISDRFQQSPFIYGEDMDGDDDLDVIACGELNDEILWWENNGLEEFSEHMVDSLIDAIHTILARDVDLDGDMDILGAACMSSQIVWYENNGAMEFVKHSLGYFPGALWLDAVDLDNDGDRDLFGAPQGASNIAWWENPGNQQFIKHNINSVFTQSFCVVPAMMDNDNDTDLVAIGWQSNKISWFENKLEDPNPYNHPECCVFDYDQNRWFISNTGGVNDPGNIVEIDEEGNQNYWKTNMVDPLGMCIGDGVLYVSEANDGVYGYDLISGEEIFYQAFSPIGNMDGMTYDGNGHLFVVDTGGKIYKIYLSNQQVTVFVSSGLTSWTQDIVFDETNNRLLAIGYAINAPIQAINLVDSSITNYTTSFSYYDGITMDQYGNVYLASHQSPGRIIKYFSSLNGTYEIVSTGHSEPAGLFYNIQDNILAVPNFGGSTVDFIYLGGHIINVPGDAPTIQAGIDVAQDGDTVLVSPGTYAENINFLGKNIVVASQFIVDDDFTHIQNTIIDGSNPTYPDTACCVRFVSGEESGTTLTGFTICNGTGTQWVDPQIPAWTWHSGGGIFIFQSSPTIQWNIITNNHVVDPMGADGASGGGLCTYGGNPLIQNNIIKNNTALYGAGVVIDYSGCVIRNNIVSGNSGGQSYGGGAFWTIGNGADPIVIENNTIVNNEVFDDGLGGAMYIWSTDLTVRNNIIWGNTQPTGDPIYSTGTPSAVITYSNVEGGYAGEGNINLPPLFADTNFLLQQNSPCIDAGNPNPAYNDREDPANPGNPIWPSFGSLINDIGVYGGGNCFFLGVISTGIQEKYNQQYQNIIEMECFPNPFKENLNIRFHLDNFDKIEISLLDISGRIVSILENNYFMKGNHQISVNLRNISGGSLSTGLYYCKLKTRESTCFQKIILTN